MTEHKLTDSAKSKGIYLLPNLLTTAGLFSGFYAVVSSMNGKFEAAAIAIFIAMIFDGLDGRVARMTKTQSAFGAEYDSMADIVSFGVAPSLVVYNWALSGLGKFGWLASFLFVACAALRLARFNTQVGVADKNYFQGLATPASAAIVASLVWVGTEYQIHGPDYGIAIGIITMLLAVLMVSNFRYSSFKEVDWRSKVNFIVVLVIVLIFVVIASSPAEMLLLIFGLYALSGPVMTVRMVRKLKLEHVVGDSDDADFDKNADNEKQHHEDVQSAQVSDANSEESEKDK